MLFPRRNGASHASQADIRAIPDASNGRLPIRSDKIPVIGAIRIGAAVQGRIRSPDVLTSGGVAAGIDLCLHLVRKDHGAEIANRLGRALVVGPHRDGGQAQFVEQPVPDTGNQRLGPALSWALEHLPRNPTIGQFAAAAAIGRRTFYREFRASTGTTPHRWLVAQRVLLACRLLETTQLTSGHLTWAAAIPRGSFSLPGGVLAGLSGVVIGIVTGGGRRFRPLRGQQAHHPPTRRAGPGSFTQLLRRRPRCHPHPEPSPRVSLRALRTVH